MLRHVTLVSLAVFAASPAFAKGPWFNGTFKGSNPVHKNGEIVVVFDNNEPKSLTFNSQMGTSDVKDLKLGFEQSTWFQYDLSVATDLTGTDQAGQPFKAKLLADVGMAEQAVLVLPSGITVTLVRQP